MLRLVAGGALGVVAVAVGAMWFLSQPRSDDPFAQCRSAAVAGQAAIGGPFELVNGQGETMTEADVITEPTLIYFGYTFCPDVCPLDTARNAEVVDLLAERGISATPVFVSIDPERDTPEVVGEYAEMMHEKMIGLTGTPEQVKAASQAYRTYYSKQETGDEYYLVDHTSLTYFMLPEHGFVDVFRRDARPEAVADTVQCFAKAVS